MSQENVEIVKRAIGAVNDRDIDRYLACCTEDVQMWTPLASIGAVYEGPDAIRRFFTDIQDTVPDFHRRTPFGAGASGCCRPGF